MAFIELHKRNVKDVCLMHFPSAIDPLIQHRATLTKNKLEVLFKNQEFQEKIFSLQQKYNKQAESRIRQSRFRLFFYRGSILVYNSLPKQLSRIGMQKCLCFEEIGIASAYKSCISDYKLAFQL